MERREILKLLASAAVLPALSQDTVAFFQDVHSQVAKSPGLKTLNPHQNATVTTIAELIIPQTNTPGVKAVKVNEFIDLILTDWYDEPTTARFIAGLADVDRRSEKLFRKKFVACAESQQTQLLKVLDDEALLARLRPRRPCEMSRVARNGTIFSKTVVCSAHQPCCSWSSAPEHAITGLDDRSARIH